MAGRLHNLLMRLALALGVVAAVPVTQGADLLEGLGAMGGGRQEKEFLHPDEAFILHSETNADGALLVEWEIAPGYYLYQDKMKFVTQAGGIELGPPEFAPALLKQDPYFGEVAIYTNYAGVTVPVARAAGSPAAFKVTVTYQGCAEGGICYPPIRKPVSYAADGAALVDATTPSSVVPDTNEVDDIALRLRDEAPLTVLASFFGFGLLLSFTPCVFPMVPILSGLIVGQGSELGTRGAFWLSLVYVGAMAFAYALAGVLAGAFGHNLQASFQHPIVLTVFAAVFIALSLAMFGLYKLQLPAGLMTRLTAFSNRHKGGHFLGVAIMGLLSAIIVGPCVAPPLAGALTYIGSQGSPLLGGLALFALGLGMGTPLLVVGTSAGTLLPRAGAWMESVQHIFGVILLGVAIWFLSRILPAPVTLALSGLLCVGGGVYLGALDPVAPGCTGWLRLRKTLGLVLSCYGLALILGAAAGGRDVLQPLRPFTAGRDAQATEAESPFRRVSSVAALDSALAAAREAGQPVMLDFYADWCVECIQMERRTFTDEAVKARMAQFVLLQADVTANNADDQALLNRFGLYGPPGIVFFDPSGTERRDLRAVGFYAPDKFLPRLQALAAD